MQKWIVIFAAILAAGNVKAAEIITENSGNLPTVVFGEAATAAGKFDEAVVVQPDNAPNPLGSPIVEVPDSSAPTAAIAKAKAKAEASAVLPKQIKAQTTEQNPSVSPQFTPEDLKNEMQNEIYESGNRVYDVQSYPADDLPTIEKQQKAVTNYPEY